MKCSYRRRCVVGRHRPRQEADRIHQEPMVRNLDGQPRACSPDLEDQVQCLESSTTTPWFNDTHVVRCEECSSGFVCVSFVHGTQFIFHLGWDKFPGARIGFSNTFASVKPSVPQALITIRRAGSTYQACSRFRRYTSERIRSTSSNDCVSPLGHFTVSFLTSSASPSQKMHSVRIF